jgi:hypothetical protein
MTPEQIENLIDMARKTHTGEITFCEFAARLRDELTKLNEAQKNETPEA